MPEHKIRMKTENVRLRPHFNLDLFSRYGAPVEMLDAEQRRVKYRCRPCESWPELCLGAVVVLVLYSWAFFMLFFCVKLLVIGDDYAGAGASFAVFLFLFGGCTFFFTPMVGVRHTDIVVESTNETGTWVIVNSVPRIGWWCVVDSRTKRIARGCRNFRKIVAKGDGTYKTKRTWHTTTIACDFKRRDKIKIMRFLHIDHQRRNESEIVNSTAAALDKHIARYN